MLLMIAAVLLGIVVLILYVTGAGVLNGGSGITINGTGMLAALTAAYLIVSTVQSRTVKTISASPMIVFLINAFFFLFRRRYCW